MGAASTGATKPRASSASRCRHAAWCGVDNSNLRKVPDVFGFEVGNSGEANGAGGRRICRDLFLDPAGEVLAVLVWNGIEETADAVWKALTTEHKKLFSDDLQLHGATLLPEP